MFAPFSFFYWSSKSFYSPSFGVFYATKIVQIDEGMNKICLFQVKGVMACCGLAHMTISHFRA